MNREKLPVGIWNKEESVLSQNYVLFGAGQCGLDAVNRLGKDRVHFFIDNYSTEHEVSGLPVYRLGQVAEKLESEQIVIAAGKACKDEMMEELRKNGLYNFVYMEDLYASIRRERLKKPLDEHSVYEKAIRWVKRNTIGGEGILNNTGLPKSYPEVTGYFIPTLLRWGNQVEAVEYAKWLCKIQKEDGSWYDTENSSPYIFDSAQVLKGLLSIRNILPEVEPHIILGCEWILSRMDESGRLLTPDKSAWGNGVAACDEIVHLYCLSPLMEAAGFLDRPEYKERALRALEYYKTVYRDKIMNFELLSHFHAYVMEALLDLGETELAREAMSGLSVYQRDSGAFPAYPNVDWVCSTGMFQLASVWYRLGETERADRLFSYACKLQNASGGWNGSYPSEEKPEEDGTYFPHSEISWAVKFFLDALYWKHNAL